MNTCGCGTSPYLAGSALPPPYEPLEGSASPTFTANGIMVVDDNWVPRVITTDGIPVTRKGITRVTDGSNAKGPIDLNPEVAAAVDSFMGLLGTRLVKIGTPIPAEGSTLMVQGQQWAVVPAGYLGKIYDPTKLRGGGRQIAAYTCASGGTVEMGVFTQSPNTVIYIDENGLAQSYPLTDFAAQMMVPLCQSAPAATDDDVVTSVLGCSQNGLVKTLTGLTKAYFHEPAVRLYWQGTTYNNSGGSVIHPPNTNVQYYPEIPEVINGIFANDFVDIDLTKQAGYNPNATSLLMSAQAGLGITSIVGFQQWFLVVLVKGRERIRITSGFASGYNTDVTQFVVPMPSDHTKLRIEVQRQISVIGDAVGETAYAAVYLEGFLFA